MEFQLTITVAEYGHDPAHGEMFMRAFKRIHPEVPVVIEQDRIDGTLTAVFEFEATDFEEASSVGAGIFTSSANATGLKATDFLAAHLVPATADVDDDVRELEYA